MKSNINIKLSKLPYTPSIQLGFTSQWIIISKKLLFSPNGGESIQESYV